MQLQFSFSQWGLIYRINKECWLKGLNSPLPFYASFISCCSQYFDGIFTVVLVNSRTLQLSRKQGLSPKLSPTPLTKAIIVHPVRASPNNLDFPSYKWCLPSVPDICNIFLPNYRGIMSWFLESSNIYMIICGRGAQAMQILATSLTF